MGRKFELPTLMFPAEVVAGAACSAFSFLLSGVNKGVLYGLFSTLFWHFVLCWRFHSLKRLPKNSAKVLSSS